jgi:chromosome segregation ATPase
LSDSPELLKPIAEVTEVTDSGLQTDLGNLKAENENLRQKLAESQDTIESLKQELAENTRYYTERLNEAGATIGTFKDKLEAVQAKKQRLQNDLGNSQAEVIELRSQLETERVDQEEAVAKLKDAQATIVAQRGKIHNLERGYGHKPTPTEGILRRQLGELQAELSDLKQKILTASELPEAADILNQLKAHRKKSSATLADVEKILEILEE